MPMHIPITDRFVIAMTFDKSFQLECRVRECYMDKAGGELTWPDYVRRFIFPTDFHGALAFIDKACTFDLKRRGQRGSKQVHHTTFT